jgi:integrase
MVTARIDRVDARFRLSPRREPYWYRLAAGRHIGFRKLLPSSPGSWLARAYDGERYEQRPLGDFVELEERQRFDAARTAAEAWFDHLKKGGSSERVTVSEACAAYVEKLRTEKSDAAADDAAGRFTRLVDDDPIGKIELDKLAPRHVATWRARVLKVQSKASFNRNASALRAALNLAHDRRDVASDHAWANELKAVKGGTARRTLVLDRVARRALIDAASDELKPLIKGLCLLPLRPGELSNCKVSDFDSKAETLRIPHGKTGGRTIPLSPEAAVFFREQTTSKLPSAWLVCRANGKQWDRFAWRDEVKLAAAAAKLPRDTVLYSLRHSVITDMVAAGADLNTVAVVSGTSLAMIAKHYAHLKQQAARDALSRLAL